MLYRCTNAECEKVWAKSELHEPPPRTPHRKQIDVFYRCPTGEWGGCGATVKEAPELETVEDAPLYTLPEAAEALRAIDALAKRDEHTDTDVMWQEVYRVRDAIDAHLALNNRPRGGG